MGSAGAVRYVAKPGTWFKAGTEVTLIDDYRPFMDAGLFLGVRICENPEAEGCPAGTESMDEEICPFDEFEIVDDLVFAYKPRKIWSN